MTATEVASGSDDDAGPGDRRSLRRLLAMCGVVGLVLLVLAGVAAGIAMSSLDRHRTQLLDRLDPAALAASRLDASLLDQETGIGATPSPVRRPSSTRTGRDAPRRRPRPP